MTDQINSLTVYELRRGKAPRKLDWFWLDNVGHDQEQRQLKSWLAEGRTLKIVPRHTPEPSRFD